MTLARTCEPMAVPASCSTGQPRIRKQLQRSSGDLRRAAAWMGFVLAGALLVIVVLLHGRGTYIKVLFRTYGPMVLSAAVCAGAWTLWRHQAERLLRFMVLWLGIIVALQIGQFIGRDQWPFARQTLAAWAQAGFSHEAWRRQDPAYRFVLFCQDRIPSGAAYAFLGSESRLHAVGHMVEYFLYPRWFHHVDPAWDAEIFWGVLHSHGIRYVIVDQRSDVPLDHPLFHASGVTAIPFDNERTLYVFPQLTGAA